MTLARAIRASKPDLDAEREVTRAAMPHASTSPSSGLRTRAASPARARVPVPAQLRVRCSRWRTAVHIDRRGMVRACTAPARPQWYAPGKRWVSRSAGVGHSPLACLGYGARNPKSVCAVRFTGTYAITRSRLRASNRDSGLATLSVDTAVKSLCFQRVSGIQGRTWHSSCKTCSVHGLPRAASSAPDLRNTKRTAARHDAPPAAGRADAGGGIDRLSCRRATAGGTAFLNGLLAKPLSNLLGALPLRDDPRDRAHRARRAEPLLRTVQLLGGVVHAQHPFINGVTVSLPNLQLELLVRVPGVLSVSLDSPVQRAAGRHGPARSHLAATLGLEESSLVRATDGRAWGWRSSIRVLPRPARTTFAASSTSRGHRAARPIRRTRRRPTSTATARTSAG